MDTDDLSTETYIAILGEAEAFNHDLALQFGLLSYHCKNEKEYIEKAIELCKEMYTIDKYDLDDMFFGNPPKRKDFKNAILKIQKNIEEVKKLPEDKKTYYF